jgi:hypothetical protein
MLTVANMPIMLNINMLSVIMLSVIMLSVIMLCVIMPNVTIIAWPIVLKANYHNTKCPQSCKKHSYSV